MKSKLPELIIVQDNVIELLKEIPPKGLKLVICDTCSYIEVKGHAHNYCYYCPGVMKSCDEMVWRTLLFKENIKNELPRARSFYSVTYFQKYLDSDYDYYNVRNKDDREAIKKWKKELIEFSLSLIPKITRGEL